MRSAPPPVSEQPPESEVGFVVVRNRDGAERLRWSPHTRDLANLMAALSRFRAGAGLAEAFLTCGLDDGVEPCGCTQHLHEDRFGTCPCGHSCVWHFEDGASAPCRGLQMVASSG